MIIHAKNELAMTKYPIRSPKTAATSMYTLPTNRTRAHTVTNAPLMKVGASATSAACIMVGSLDRVQADVVLRSARHRLLDGQDVVHDGVDLVVVEGTRVLHAPRWHVRAGAPLGDGV